MNKKYKYCFKEKKLIEYTTHGDNSCKKSDEKITQVVFSGNSAKVLTETAAIYKDCDDFFSNFPSELCELNLTRRNYEKTMKLITNIVKHAEQLSIKLVKKNCTESSDSVENIKKGTNHILEKLKDIETIHKLKTNITKNPLYVEPIEKSIGLKWKYPKVDPETEIPDHGLIQSTFQYVPILKTLQALFSNKDFYETYVKYNLHEKHKCVPGIYQGFCCGSIHKSIDIFNEPLALKIQIGSDDFEVCCPIKSHAKTHKINGTYFQITNMPIEYRSKLNNIYLVALCSSLNFKVDEYDYNHIAELMYDEFSVLETDGLEINLEIRKEANINLEQDRFYGTLINIAVDNLGASEVMGFVESFSATHYCRHCECTKTECQEMTKENKRKRRKIEKYNHDVEIAENKEVKQNVIATMGVKRRCRFNDLKFFHILNNMSVDLMHDVNEGVILYCLFDFFHLIVKTEKILTEHELQQRIRDFNYGQTSKHNKPSLINIEKKTLNQNASQLYCLIVNLPFILLDLKDQIEKHWQPVQTLLSCMQILYSPEISERHVKSLEKLIQSHLKAVLETFKRNLTPKHHFLVHYPEYIRRMGPPIHHWAMRFESKHRVLTEISRRKMNFGNLPKTLAREHQVRMCKQPTLKTELKPSKKSRKFCNSMQFQRFEEILKRDIGAKYIETRIHNFASYDNIEYRPGGLVIENGRLYEIIHILSIDSNLFLLCYLNKIIKKDKFTNSILFEKMIDSTIAFDLNKLKNKLVFEKIHSHGKHFLISDKLVVESLI